MTKPPVTPADYVGATASANQYEIIAAHVALVTSPHEPIRRLAQQMLQDHEAAMDTLRQAAMKSGLAPPAAVVGAEQAPLLAALQSLRDAEFDRAYVR